jgi:hypothetical protein
MRLAGNHVHTQRRGREGSGLAAPQPANHFIYRSVHDHGTVLKQHAAFADVGYQVQVVADDYERLSRCRQLLDLCKALFLERFVPDGQDFIHQEQSGSVCTATEKASRRYMPEE